MGALRQTLGWMLILAVVVLAGDRLIALVLERVLLQSQFRFSRVYRAGSDADVIVIGDSRGVNSFYAPAIEKATGRPALNLSYNSMSIRLAEALLTDYLDHHRPPRMVILEVTAVCNSPAPLAPELRTYAGLSPRIRTIFEQYHPRTAAASRLFHLLPFNSEFFLRSLFYLRRSDQDWIARSQITSALMARPPVDFLFDVKKENLGALERLIRRLRERGVVVRLVVVPYYRTVMLTHRPELLRVITATARRADAQAVVLDYSAALKAPELFADRVHLNQRGSEALLAILVRDGVIPSPAPQPPR